ncbi:MAG: hypothetical protein JJ899_10280, partial [Alphaproteobacteria bacterium]|nr:hypothetical protein [Alphaproteobacteria bacterium]
YIGAFVALVLIGAAVLGVLAATNGTAVRIGPDEATQTGRVSVADGIGVVISGTVYSFAAPPVISVSADGFREIVHVITPEEVGDT